MDIKRTIKHRISDCVFVFRKLNCTRLLKKGNFRILLYHSIDNSDLEKDKMGLAVPVKTFYNHMKYLKENEFFVMDLPELVGRITDELLIPEKSVAITFDDGFKSVLTNALPILKEFGFTATLFVNIYFLERRLPESLYWHDWQTLNWKEIQLLHEAGMTVGSHAFTHKILIKMSNGELKKEIMESKELIEKNIGDKIFAFSYPHGAFNKKVKKVLKENKFCCACTSIEGINNSHSDIFSLRRTEITAFEDTSLKFEKKILGSHDWLRFIRSND